MDTEEASTSFSLQYAYGDTWQSEVSFLRLLFCSPLGGQLGKHHRASDGRAAGFLPGIIRGFSPSLGSVCHLGSGFYQLVNCSLSSSSRIKYSFFVCDGKKCFLSFKTVFSIIPYHHQVLFLSFDAKFQTLTISAVKILILIMEYFYIISITCYFLNYHLIV